VPLTPAERASLTRRQNLAGAVATATALAALLGLAACLPGAGGPPAALARLNPMVVDTRLLRTAVRLPDTARIVDSELTMTTALAGSDTPEVRHFPLIASHDPADRAALGSAAKAGFALAVFRLDPTQAAALDAWRTRLASTRHGKLTISLRTDACRVSGNATDPVPMTTYIAAAPAEGFHMLTAETDLVNIARDMGRPFALPRCGSP
jgi:hypothetical protein